MPAHAQLNIDVDSDTTKWFNRTQHIGNVDVLAQRGRYSRKDNPAVELMRKVISAKRRSDLSRRDYYRYNKYQKLTLAINEITPTRMEDPMFSNKQWLLRQVEFCPYNNKLILPVSVSETVTEQIYRREPRAGRSILRGTNSQGIGDLLQTGDMLNTVLKDIFTDVNIYDEQIRLLQSLFTSPIADGALDFYRYYIEDTLYIGRNLCYHLSFLPNNQQDFGFRGELFVLADSSYQVRRCQMTIPPQSDVNFIDGMKLVQEFSQLDDGSWVLTDDDLFTELRWANFMESFAVVRSTRLSDFSFTPLPHTLFKSGDAQVRREEREAKRRGADFWEQYRQVRLTRGESSMKQFIRDIGHVRGFKYLFFGLKILVDNYIETGTKRHPSKVDIGPVNTLLTANYVDGLRTRLSAQTTANLDSNFFFRGYVARGWSSHKTYYSGDIIWSLNKKDYLPHEYPKRTFTFSSTYDVMSPCDRFIDTDKDNVFAALKWSSVEQMMFYNRQQLAFEYETYNGMKYTLSAKTEHDAPAGDIDFEPFRTTELHAELRYAPGETYINTKQRRMPVNHEAPVLTLGHTVGLSGVLGGDHNFHLTEATLYKRFWLADSWGNIDCRLKGVIQWSKVPYMLLIMPEANLSYILSDNTFCLVNNMEFLTDRYVSAMLNWDMNGKLFNRIPLLRRLKWREWFAVRCLWGDLTEKNTIVSPLTSHFSPLTSPYWELSFGIHNIFKLFHIEYVRRLNYLDQPSVHKQGVRFNMRLTF